MLLGSLHNYRLFLHRHGMTEISQTSGQHRLTVFGHGLAGLFAGWTRSVLFQLVFRWILSSNRCTLISQQCPDCYPNRTFERLELNSDEIHNSRLTFAVKLQLQSQRLVTDRQFKSPIDCGRQIIQVQGPRGLWSGFIGSLAFRSNFFWMFLSVEVHAAFPESWAELKSLMSF